MTYKAKQIMSKRIEHAMAISAITAGEAMTLIHHLALSGRGKYHYVSEGDRALVSDIAKRVRIFNDGVSA